MIIDFCIQDRKSNTKQFLSLPKLLTIPLPRSLSLLKRGAEKERLHYYFMISHKVSFEYYLIQGGIVEQTGNCKIITRIKCYAMSFQVKVRTAYIDPEILKEIK